MSAAVNLNLNFWRRSLCLKLKWWRSCRRSHYVFHTVDIFFFSPHRWYLFFSLHRWYLFFHSTVDIHFFSTKKRRYCFTRKKRPQSIVFKCCLFAFFCLLSVLCFVVNNVFRQKIYLRFWSEVQFAVPDVLSFFPFSSHVTFQNCLLF